MTDAATRIYRDRWGTPHIRATADRDAFHALGYAQAEDQLDRVLLNYLCLTGRAAAVLGEKPLPVEQAVFGPTAVTSDLLQERWGHLREARRGFDRASGELQDVLTAFVEGLGRGLAAQRSRLPAWAAEVVLEPAMSLAVNRVMWWHYAIRDALLTAADAGARLQPAVSAIPLSAEADEGAQAAGEGQSNVWVVLPERTADGGLVCLSDPHGPLDVLPFFEAEATTARGAFAGFFFAGAALPLLGSSLDLAWGLTTGAPRVSDVYLLGQDCPADQRQVVVEVCGEAPVRQVMETVVLNDIQSPVVGSLEGARVAVCTPYMHVPELYEEQLLGQLMARDVSEFAKAFEQVASFPMNVMVGDRHGDAWYVRAGRIPVRSSSVTQSRVLDAADPNDRWEGLHPLDCLVQLGNPECGFMQNNNVSPDRMLPAGEPQAIDASRYPWYVFGDQPGRTNTRGRRALELLSRLDRMTVGDAVQVATDDTWVDLEAWQVALRSALHREVSPSAEGRALLEGVLSFDGRASAESSGAAQYHVWRAQLLMLGDAGEYDVDELSDRIEAAKPIDQHDAEVLIRAADAAAAVLVHSFGVVDPTHGAVFRIRRGDVDAPSRASGIRTRSRVDPENPFGEYLLPLQMMLHDDPDEHGIRRAALGSHTLRLTIFGEAVTCFSLMLYGQSSDPTSPHFADQIELFTTGSLKPVLLGVDDPSSNCARVTILERPVSS
jgi:acyl-homoserine lactone acylase PvdQ